MKLSARAWELLGKPTDQIPDPVERDDPCYLCGLQSRVTRSVPRRDVLASTFTDHAAARSASSEWVCTPCAWSLRGRCEARKKPGLSPKGKPKRAPWIRTFSVICHGPEVEILDKGQKPRIRELLLDPPSWPFGAALADTGQKHTLIYAPVNPEESGSIAIRFEVRTVIFVRDDLKVLISLATELYEGGITKAEIASGNYSTSRVTAFGTWRWNEIENRLKARRGGAVFDLAVWLTTKETTDGDQRHAGRADGNASTMPSEDIGPANHVGQDPERGPGLSGERGDLGRDHRVDQPPARNRKSTMAGHTGDEQMSLFG